MRSPSTAIAVALAAAIVTAGGAVLAAPVKCTLARIAEWPVRPDAGYAVVDGAVNGQKVGVLLDTGSTRTLLMRGAAVRLGPVRYDAGGSRVIAIGGETAADVVSVDELAIGADVRRNMRMLVAGEHDLGDDVAVVLGEDFFRQIDVEFDLSHNAVRLFRARDCDGTSLAYWATGRAAQVDLESDSTADSHVELQVEVNGHRMFAQLDSGARQSSLTKSAAESVGITPESRGVVAAGCFMGAGSRSIEAWIGPFDTFGIGNEVIRDPRIHFADLYKYSTYTETGSLVRRGVSRADMLLGADFLRAHRVLVAHSQRKMYFTYVGGPVFPAVPGKPCAKTPRGDAATKADAKGH